MNMNAVRSHYPPDSHFLEVCDSIGLLYLNELCGWQNSYSTEIAEKLLPEMMFRDVNHPCIFIWANGNEGGWNTAIDNRFANYDPQNATSFIRGQTSMVWIHAIIPTVRITCIGWNADIRFS